jgi:hypothetical protein
MLRHCVSLGLRDTTNSLPDRSTVVKVIAINPHGQVSTTNVVVPRGMKTLRNHGGNVTYPSDFFPVDRGGLDQNLQTGVYTVLWELQNGIQIACNGFVGQDDPHAQNVTP